MYRLVNYPFGLGEIFVNFTPIYLVNFSHQLNGKFDNFKITLYVRLNESTNLT